MVKTTKNRIQMKKTANPASRCPPINVWVADRRMTVTSIGTGLMAVTPDSKIKTPPFDMEVGDRVDFYAVDIGSEVAHVASNFTITWNEQ